MGFGFKSGKVRRRKPSFSAKGRKRFRLKSLVSNGTHTHSRLARRTATGKRSGSSPSPPPGSSSSAASPEAPSSVPTRATPEERLEAGFFVMDSVNHRRREGDPAGPGVILVLRDCRPTDFESLVGLPAIIHSTIGVMIIASVAAVRDHGTTISVLIEGLTRDAVPIGSDFGFILDATRGVRIPGADLASLVRTSRASPARDEPAGRAVLT